MKIPAELLTLLTAATLAGCALRTPKASPAPAAATEPDSEPDEEVLTDEEVEDLEDLSLPGELVKPPLDDCPGCGMG